MVIIKTKILVLIMVPNPGSKKAMHPMPLPCTPHHCIASPLQGFHVQDPSKAELGGFLTGCYSRSQCQKASRSSTSLGFNSFPCNRERTPCVIFSSMVFSRDVGFQRGESFLISSINKEGNRQKASDLGIIIMDCLTVSSKQPSCLQRFARRKSLVQPVLQ